MKEETERAAVLPLIERATNSTAADVDPRLLKAIKSSVRSSDPELRCAAQTLLSLMKRDHSQVRYLALLIINELFMRSKLFRTLMVENLDQLLSLSIGFRRNLPLPAPTSVASVLRSKAIELLEKWNVTFGIHYRQLRLGYDYLKNTLRFQFPNLQANAARIQHERKERELRTREILLKKFESLKTSISSIKDEIRSTVDEIGECLDILKTEDEHLPYATVDGEEIEEFRNSELRQIRHDSLREGGKIQESSENKIVFDALRELYKVLVTKHLAGVQEWLSVLIRVDVEDNRFRDSTLKEFIDIRNIIRLTKDKCEESGCALPNVANTEEEDIWEDGTLQGFEKGYSVSNHSDGNDCPVASTADDAKGIEFHNKVSNKNMINSCDSGRSESNPARGKLLAEAPVFTWGSFLDNWGSNRDVLANHRGLDLEGHWGRVDCDAVIPAEKIAELNVQASVYKEEPVEIKPCRAPSRNGQLCQRRDLRVCPFHGLIIPRDDEGNPISESSMVEDTDPQNQSGEMNPDVDSDKVEQLLKQAVQNVRERERKEAKKSQSDKQALKRAKLAEVRAHNEAVLRDAAVASTSRSSHIGGDMELGNGSKSSSRIKKQTLASMLKKKDTAKDRLAQRLLSTGARESTIRQLTESEDANYREAFPNQW
ncbi:UV-stimulated scaffold protein A homolog [Primulina eburnea]|uniref:UV-stimulated scaffold protein A homolog n=1 Tax=Primulina eburnea TaxID=1245227 RepID=UPI003C6C1DEA